MDENRSVQDYGCQDGDTIVLTLGLSGGARGWWVYPLVNVPSFLLPMGVDSLRLTRGDPPSFVGRRGPRHKGRGRRFTPGLGEEKSDDSDDSDEEEDVDAKKKPKKQQGVRYKLPP